jgi:hypothetical protein
MSRELKQSRALACRRVPIEDCRARQRAVVRGWRAVSHGFCLAAGVSLVRAACTLEALVGLARLTPPCLAFMMLPGFSTNLLIFFIPRYRLFPQRVYSSTISSLLIIAEISPV